VKIPDYWQLYLNSKLNYWSQHWQWHWQCSNWSC